MVHERQTSIGIYGIYGTRKKISQEDTLISLQEYEGWHGHVHTNLRNKH